MVTAQNRSMYTLWEERGRLGKCEAEDNGGRKSNANANSCCSWSCSCFVDCPHSCSAVTFG